MNISEVLEKLRQRTTPLQVNKSVEYEEEQFSCRVCKDKKIIIYRVHKDTEWKEVQGFGTLIPESMVTEDDFFAGKVCTPDQGWEWRDTFSRQCKCVEQDRLKKIMKSSDITEEFKKLSFQNFRTEGKPQVIKDSYECAVEYFQEYEAIKDSRHNSIALLGQPGAGKTHLLTAIANNLINRLHVPVLYFPYVEGFTDLRDDFDKLEEKLDRMKKIDVLFVDDLFKPTGKERKARASEWQIEQMYAVINHRYLNHMPIMVSSELDIDEIEQIDEALGTRIRQMCQDFMVLIKGDRKLLNHRLEGW
ncbi:ATP-binding protein [Lederbergia wuyishanensis]